MLLGSIARHKRSKYTRPLWPAKNVPRVVEQAKLIQFQMGTIYTCSNMRPVLHAGVVPSVVPGQSLGPSGLSVVRLKSVTVVHLWSLLACTCLCRLTLASVGLNWSLSAYSGLFRPTLFSVAYSLSLRVGLLWHVLVNP